MNGHSIHLSIGNGGLESVEWRCHQPPDADCRAWCEKPECEEGCTNYLAHRRDWKHSDQCLQLVFLEEGGTWDEQYEGPTTDVRSGPIELMWRGDCYSWSYA